MRVNMKTPLVLKFAALFLIMTAGLAAVSLIAFESLKTIKKGVDTLYFGSLIPSGHLHAILDAYNTGVIDTVHQTATGTMTVEAGAHRIRSALGKVESHWREYSQIYKNPREAELVAATRELMHATNRQIAIILAELEDGRSEELAKLAEEHLYPAVAPMRSIIEELARYEFQAGRVEKDRANTLYDITLGKVTSVLFFVLLFSTVLAVLIMVRVHRQQRDLEKLNAELVRMSITDGLTGLHNRRYFDSVFPREMNRAKRQKNPLALMILDVDFFKKYNDTYGHQAGDRVLERVGEALGNSFRRAGDYAFRLGGEEFGVLLTEGAPEHVEKIGEKVCEAIRELKIPHRQNDAAETVTISVGIAYLADATGHFCKEVYHVADEALYAAKEGGRNRFRFTAL